MLLFTVGQASEDFVVTLNEKRTLDSGYYLFVFTNVTTKNVVNKIYNFTEDASAYPTRFNQFNINTSTVFLNQDPGGWRYEVYEQASSSNTVVTGLTEVERGIMQLRSTEATFEDYDAATTYKQYG